MAVIAVCSAKGAPGVTTTALLLAALWPRPALLVDADPAGGDVALRLPDPEGHPLDPNRGLLTLLPLARRALAPSVLFDHAQTVTGGIPVVAGLAGPEQAGAVGPLWDTLALAFAGVPGADVIVDAGRSHAKSVHLPLLARADLVITVLRPSVAGVVHAREQLRSLEHALVRSDGVGPRLAFVTVSDVDDRRAEEVAATVRSDLPRMVSLGRIALDPKGAGVFDGARVSRPERTMLVRSGRQVLEAVVAAMPRSEAAAQPPAPAQQPPAQQPPAQQPPAQQPVAQQPVAQQPVAQQPPVQPPSQALSA